MPDLSDLVQFHSGQVENFYLFILGQVHMYEVDTTLNFWSYFDYFELISCIENSVDPDQLASEEAS